MSASPEVPTTVDGLVAAAGRDGVEFVLFMFVDMHGKPCAKLVPTAALGEVATAGAGFAGFAAGPLGQTPADPDLMAVPDPRSYTVLPWKPELAVVQCDPTVEGEAWPFAPRVILRRQLDLLAARGLTLMCGAEAEYFLVRRTADGGLAVADEKDVAANPCYDARGLLRMYDHLATVSRHLNTLGWGNYANDHEDANGQFEQNFRYADALTTADRLVLFRYLVHSLAEEAGMEATFMPKPFSHLTGSGLHVHLSLWADGEELFVDPADPRGLGMSSMAYSFIGGLLDHAPASAAVLCPTVNSYKRMGAAAPSSGATWAPAYVAYGGNNRTHMLRIPEPGRVENRSVDGSANPYLAFAVLAGAGLDGIDRQIDPGTPNTANLAERGLRALPPTLLHATEALTGDPVVRAALGKTRDGEYAEYFARVKRDEFMAYHARISPWEIDTYLTLM
jgi:glutamine synthetase